MKNYILKTLSLFFVAVLVLGSTACKKSFLDKKPDGSIAAQQYFKTDAQVTGTTDFLYNKVWFDYVQKAYYNVIEGMAGNLLAPSWDAEFLPFASNDASPRVLEVWRSLFAVVAQSNQIKGDIEKYAGDAVSPAVKNSAIGECVFMRAMAYYQLVQLFGNIPLYDKDLVNISAPQLHNIKSAWKFIIRDLKKAIELLPTASTIPGRVNKWAAKAMLAKVYLTYAGFVSTTPGTRDQLYLDSAAMYSKEVILGNAYSLLPAYKDLFVMTNNINSESIVGLQYRFNGEYGMKNVLQAFLAFTSPQITGTWDGWGGDIGGTYELISKYDPADNRRKYTFFYPGQHYSDFRWNPAKDGTTIIDMQVPVNTTNDMATGVQNIKANRRAWVKKYVYGGPWDNGGKVDAMNTGGAVYLLRLPEVYFTYADAILGNNASTTDPTALLYVNKVRQRAGLGNLTTITEDVLLNERRLEFPVEAQYWYDLMRLYYYKPGKVTKMLNDQLHGQDQYYIKPNQETFATVWTLVYDPSTVNGVPTKNTTRFNEDNNRDNDPKIYLPIPAAEKASAPFLNQPPVDFVF